MGYKEERGATRVYWLKVEKRAPEAQNDGPPSADLEIESGSESESDVVPQSGHRNLTLKERKEDEEEHQKQHQKQHQRQRAPVHNLLDDLLPPSAGSRTRTSMQISSTSILNRSENAVYLKRDFVESLREETLCLAPYKLNDEIDDGIHDIR